MEQLCLFDNNKETIGTDVNGIKVSYVDEVEDYIKNNKVDIVAITVPKESAIKAASNGSDSK